MATVDNGVPGSLVGADSPTPEPPVATRRRSPLTSFLRAEAAGGVALVRGNAAGAGHVDLWGDLLDAPRLTCSALELPRSGWRVNFDDAFKAFVLQPANLPHVGAVSDWIVAVRANDPPLDSISAGGDLHILSVPSAPVMAEYFIIEAECLVIMKRFDRAWLRAPAH